MTTETTSIGGFTGDPAEALTPATAGGCCGSAPVASAGATPAASTCCGTAAEAAESSSCCGETAKAEAISSGAGCCG